MSLCVGKPLDGDLVIHIEADELANMDVFSLSDPFALLEIATSDGKWREIGRTETIWDHLNPKWVKSFELPSTTRADEQLRVSVYDRDARTDDLGRQEKIGTAECEVWELLKQGTKGRTLNLQNDALKQCGNITITSEIFPPEATGLHSLEVTKCKFRRTTIIGKVRPKMKSAYVTISRRRANNEWVPIFRASDDGTCISQPSRLDTGECTPLRFELRGHRIAHEHKLIGAVNVSLASLRRGGVGKKLPLGLTGENVGEMGITAAVLDETSSKFEIEVCFAPK